MINLGLSRITALVSQLPTKQTWKAIHIAGTNGKGSVASYLSSLFLRLSRPSNAETELKIGRFTSPHLIDRWDCITINDQPVSESLFLQVERQVQGYAAKVNEENRAKLKSNDTNHNNNHTHNHHHNHSHNNNHNHTHNHNHQNDDITEFELLTATAFEIFSQQNCQVAIIECGLGGRLDATNVLTPPQVACSVITKIGLDHMGILGNNLESIAREKAAIVKKDVPMVVDGTNPFGVIEAIALIANSRNIAPTLSRAPDIEYEWNIHPVDGVGTMPPHQYNNLVLALTAFMKCQPHLPALQFARPRKLDLPVILRDVQTSYPARLQHLSITKLFPTYKKPILLDGAHNPQSAEVLRAYADSLASNKKGFFKTRLTRNLCPPRTWILALSRGKESTQILSTLLERHDKVIACHFSRVDGMPWVQPMSPDEIASVAGPLVQPGNVAVAADVLHALQIATGGCVGKGGWEKKEGEAGHEHREGDVDRDHKDREREREHKEKQGAASQGHNDVPSGNETDHKTGKEPEKLSPSKNPHPHAATHAEREKQTTETDHHKHKIPHRPKNKDHTKDHNKDKDKDKDKTKKSALNLALGSHSHLHLHSHSRSNSSSSSSSSSSVNPDPSPDEGEGEGDGDIDIIVAGSLYLASDLLRALRDGPASVMERFEIGVAI